MGPSRNGIGEITDRDAPHPMFYARRMLDLQCTCGWGCQGETRDDLLVQVKDHVGGCSFWAEQGGPPDDGTLRAVIAQRARPLDDA